MNYKRVTSLIFCVFLTGIFFVSTEGQIPGGLEQNTPTGMGGDAFIVGTVFFPNGTPINTRMRIKLSTFRGVEIITTTDERGQFMFSGLSAGSYDVVIDREREYEPVSRSVEVGNTRFTPRQNYTVYIRLVGTTATMNKSAVVGANTLSAPKKAQQFFEKAKSFAADQDRKRAIEQLNLAILEYPEFVDAYNELGVQYMQLGELEHANDALVKALAIKKDALEPLLNHGITLFRMKRFSDAESELRSALVRKPGSPVALFYLGRTLTEQRKFDEAEAALNDALKFGRDEMVEAHRMLVRLFIEKEELKEAVTELEIYLKLVPDPPDKTKLLKVRDQLLSALQTNPK